jgi:hypothetical protein
MQGLEHPAIVPINLTPDPDAPSHMIAAAGSRSTKPSGRFSR